jgi:hypothetical protein
MFFVASPSSRVAAYLEKKARDIRGINAYRRRESMGRGGYTAGHTQVFVGEDGTAWPTPIDAAQSEKWRKRWSDNPRSDECGGSAAPNLRFKTYEMKLLAGFAQCYRGQQPINKLPLIPLRMAEHIIRAGGLVEWINADRKRVERFWKFVRDQSAAPAARSRPRQAGTNRTS